MTSTAKVTGLRLALGHQARVGKDTLADHVLATYGGVKLSIAAPIYDIARHIQQVLEVAQEKDPGLLQTVGTELRAHYGDDVWIAKTIARVRQLVDLNADVNIIVADMRFPNEMEALSAAGFTTVKIVRPGRVIDRDPAHPSETALASYEFDYTIINDGDRAAYRASIDSLIAACTTK